MSRIADETLGAYADGEMAAEERAAIAAAVAADPDAALRLARLRRADAALREAFPEPEPAEVDLLAERILGGASARRPRPAPSRTWLMPATAVVLALVVGVAAGRFVQPAPTFGSDPAVGLVAGGDLARSLDRLAADEADGPVRLAASYRTDAAGLCREFDYGEAVRGLACRAGDRWRVLALGRAETAPEGGYRTAGGEGSPVVEAALDDLGVSETLDPAGEAQARARGWR